MFPRNIFQDFGASLVSGPVERHDALVANDGNHGLGTFTRAMAGRSRAWRGHLLLQQVYPYMTPQQHICISARKFNNGGVAGHSTREGHHVDGPWGTKGRHQHDSKRLQHSPGAIRYIDVVLKVNFQVLFLFTAMPTIACSAGRTAMIFLDTSTNSQTTMGRLGFGPIFIMIEDSFMTLARVTPCVVPQVSE